MRFIPWIVVVTMTPLSLPAQALEPGRPEYGFGFTMQTPPDVNLPPGSSRARLEGTAPVQQAGASIAGWAKPVWIRVQFDYRFTRDEPREISGGRSLIAVGFTPGGQ